MVGYEAAASAMCSLELVPCSDVALELKSASPSLRADKPPKDQGDDVRNVLVTGISTGCLCVIPLRISGGGRKLSKSRAAHPHFVAPPILTPFYIYVPNPS